LKKRLTAKEVERFVNRFLEHIAAHWDFYRQHLPHLRRTMVVYDEFSMATRFLPEAPGFNPKNPLIEDLPKVFGRRYTEKIYRLVYDAWGSSNFEFPTNFRGDCYPEPIEDTPEALMRAWPTRFQTIAQARHHLATASGYRSYRGRRVSVGPAGTPEFRYRGFTTVKEFPAQKRFLDEVRNHPRIKLGMRRRRARVAEAVP
jgi:hypothetical protein